jgi:hypothetical protein
MSDPHLFFLAGSPIPMHCRIRGRSGRYLQRRGRSGRATGKPGKFPFIGVKDARWLH